MDARSALRVASWRREVHALYAEVRASPDPVTAHARWTAGRSRLFAEHPASPRQPGQVLRHAAYDPAYRFAVEPTTGAPERWEAQTGSDGVAAFERVGRFVLPGVGGLDAWWLGSYGGGLFVPMRDGTAGRTTYGAGRYVLDTVKGADLGREDERWVVDLNFAYHPSCAYDAGVGLPARAGRQPRRRGGAGG